MKLIWTGLLPWWAAMLCFLALASVTLWSYRKQPVRRPWSVILPALRITAGLLLLLALMQPVLSEESVNVIRGRIPVIVDNSGSMSVKDQYPDHELVRIAWHLEKFPRKLRNAAFEKHSDLIKDLSQPFSMLQKKATALLALGKEKNRNSAKTRTSRLVEEIRNTRAAISAAIEGIDSLVNNTDYLQVAGSESSKTNGFAAAFSEWKKGPLGWKSRAGGWIESVEKQKKDADWKKAVETAAAISETVANWQRELPAQIELFKKLQQKADTELASAGITTVDDAIEEVKQMNRMEIVKSSLLGPPHNLLSRLREKGEVHIFGLNEPVEPLGQNGLTNMTASLASTRLASVLRRVFQHFEQEPLSAVVVASDGNNNAGKTLQSAAELASGLRVPVIVAGAGAAEPPEDVVIESIDVPDTSFKEDRLNVNVTLRRNGFRKKPLELKVTRGGETVRTVEVPPGPETRVTVDASFTENRHGALAYNVEVKPQEGEILERNNTRGFEVLVLEDRIKTLLVDEYPRWETRYVRMMLSRDRRVELQTIFVGSQDKEMLKTGRNMYPENRKELFAHHLVFLGDVNPKHFSRAQLRDLHDFVTERGGTLMVMAGKLYMPEAYIGTPLLDLFPFHTRPLADRLSTENRPEGSVRIRLQPVFEGRHDSLIQIGRTPEQTEQLWENLPGMNWVNNRVATAPAAHKLIAAEDDRPVLVKAYAGAGKVLYVGSDSFWRWRDRARWRYHHRFWGQIVLWAAAGRTTGSDKNVKLMSNRLRYAPGEVVRLRARLLDDEGIPIEHAQTTIEVLNEKDEVVRKTSMLPVRDEPGEYRTELHGLPRGRFRVRPQVFELREKEVEAEINFEIGDLAVGEYVDLALDRKRVQKWANHYADVYNPLEIVERIEPVEIREREREDYEIWDTFYFILLVTLLLGTEWQLRKRVRLA